MKPGRFCLVLLLIGGAGVSVLLWTRARIEQGKQALARAEQPPSGRPPDNAPKPKPSPPAELLRLRNEVTLLRKELQQFQRQALPLAPQKSASDWEAIHSGPAPSAQPGFVAVASLTPAGQATPAQAFQTFQFLLRNQQHEPLTPTKMKEMFEVPDDFDDPAARYSINLGQGFGSEIGYRIAREQFLSSNEVCVTVDFETADGGLDRQDRVLVFRHGKWRVKPASVSARP